MRRSLFSDAGRALQQRASGVVAELQRRTMLALFGEPPSVRSSQLETTASAAVVERQPTLGPLSVGWHPDPYRRWKARYWNGQYWTAQVANPGDGHPEFGTDVIVPSAGDVSATTASVVLLESFINGELVRLRGEADKWRAIAEERGLALARWEGAMAPSEAVPDAKQNTTCWYARIYRQ